MLKLLLLLWSICATAIPADCENHLTNGSSPPQLGIGVLMETESNDLVLAVGPYVECLHATIISLLSTNYQISSIKWLGELRFIQSGDKIGILEANETSGLYAEREKMPWPVQNDFDSLPPVLRSATFRGTHYGDSDHIHLVEELPNENIRHSLKGAMAEFIALARLSQRPQISLSQKIDLIKRGQNSMALLEWTVIYMRGEHQLPVEVSNEIYRAITILKNVPVVHHVEPIDIDLLRREIDRFDDLIIVLTESFDRIKIFEVISPKDP